MDGKRTAYLVIPGILPNLNDYIATERIHRQKAAAMKRQTEQVVILCAKSQLRGGQVQRAGYHAVFLV